MATFEVVSLAWMADYFSELLLRLTLFLVSRTWRMMWRGKAAECAEGPRGRKCDIKKLYKSWSNCSQENISKKKKKEKKTACGKNFGLEIAGNLYNVLDRLTVNYQNLFLRGFHLVHTSAIPILDLKRVQFFQTVIYFFFFLFNISRLWVSVCVCVFLTGRPMGLLSCKPQNSCLQSKEACGPAGGCCSRACDDWRYCSDHCCDICCQMCVNVCSGLCSGDCSYTFCTLCLILAQNCVSLFTGQPTRTSQRKSCCPPLQQPLYWLPVSATLYLVWLFFYLF